VLACSDATLAVGQGRPLARVVSIQIYDAVQCGNCEQRTVRGVTRCLFGSKTLHTISLTVTTPWKFGPDKILATLKVHSHRYGTVMLVCTDRYCTVTLQCVPTVTVR
jgi:hypothetical protein